MSAPLAKRQKASRRRVGIVGYGKLGQYLAKAILDDPKASCKLELAFVWNRTAAAVKEDKSIPAEAVLEDLGDFASRNADLIVEVAHPDITLTYGRAFMEHADYLVGSPTAFANEACESIVQDMMKQEEGGGAASAGAGGEAKEEAAKRFEHALYIPSGALWGAKDIQKMANRGTLTGLSVTMKKAPGA